MTAQAKGEFQVKLTPVSDPGQPEDAAPARMTIAKQFQGDLQAESAGQMLSVGTEVRGSAGYVALERVTGVLGGKFGTFALQHHGVMDRGKPELSIIVVPDSGTGELTGLTGKMEIIIADGRHSYEFAYSLPDPQ